MTTLYQPRFIVLHGSSSSATTTSGGGLSSSLTDQNRLHNAMLRSANRVGMDICINKARSGWWLDDGSSSDFMSVYAADIVEADALVPSGYLKVVNLWLGQNDFQSRTAAAIYADIQTIAQAWRTAGWKVCVTTPLCRSNASEHTKALDLATLERAGHAALTLASDVLADVIADSHFDESADTQNLTYFADDDTHANIAGVWIYAGIIMDAILTL